MMNKKTLISKSTSKKVKVKITNRKASPKEKIETPKTEIPLSKYKKLMKEYPNLTDNLREKELNILTLFLKGYDLKRIGIILKIPYNLVRNYIYGTQTRRSLYSIMYIIPKEETEKEKTLLRQKYNNIIKKYIDWKQKITIKESTIVKLWIKGYETDEIADIVKLPVNSVRCSIYGRDRARKDSILNNIRYSR
jgi:DNA-binding CsgD family transcriptional regulator